MKLNLKNLRPVPQDCADQTLPLGTFRIKSKFRFGMFEAISLIVLCLTLLSFAR
jgi:hypothetical protein